MLLVSDVQCFDRNFVLSVEYNKTNHSKQEAVSVIMMNEKNVQQQREHESAGNWKEIKFSTAVRMIEHQRIKRGKQKYTAESHHHQPHRAAGSNLPFYPTRRRISILPASKLESYFFSHTSPRKATQKLRDDRQRWRMFCGAEQEKGAQVDETETARRRRLVGRIVPLYQNSNSLRHHDSPQRASTSDLYYDIRSNVEAATSESLAIERIGIRESGVVVGADGVVVDIRTVSYECVSRLLQRGRRCRQFCRATETHPLLPSRSFSESSSFLRCRSTSPLTLNAKIQVPQAVNPSKWTSPRMLHSSSSVPIRSRNESFPHNRSKRNDKSKCADPFSVPLTSAQHNAIPCTNVVHITDTSNVPSSIATVNDQLTAPTDSYHTRGGGGSNSSSGVVSSSSGSSVGTGGGTTDEVTVYRKICDLSLAKATGADASVYSAPNETITCSSGRRNSSCSGTVDSDHDDARIFKVSPDGSKDLHTCPEPPFQSLPPSPSPPSPSACLPSSQDAAGSTDEGWGTVQKTLSTTLQTEKHHDGNIIPQESTTALAKARENYLSAETFTASTSVDGNSSPTTTTALRKISIEAATLNYVTQALESPGVGGSPQWNDLGRLSLTGAFSVEEELEVQEAERKKRSADVAIKLSTSLHSTGTCSQRSSSSDDSTSFQKLFNQLKRRSSVASQDVSHALKGFKAFCVMQDAGLSPLPDGAPPLGSSTLLPKGPSDQTCTRIESGDADKKKGTETKKDHDDKSDMVSNATKDVEYHPPTPSAQEVQTQCQDNQIVPSFEYSDDTWCYDSQCGSDHNI